MSSKASLMLSILRGVQDERKERILVSLSVPDCWNIQDLWNLDN